MANFCHECGEQAKPNAKYCSECGNTLIHEHSKQDSINETLNLKGESEDQAVLDLTDNKNSVGTEQIDLHTDAIPDTYNNEAAYAETANYEVDTDDDQTEDFNQPSGIRGWLLLPAVGLIISLIMLPLWIAEVLAVLPELTQFDNELRTYFSAELVLSSALLVLAVVTAYHFFGRRRGTKPLYITLLSVNLFLVFIFAVWGSSLDLTQEYKDELLSDMFRGMVGAAIWIPYFSMSKRVKNTFIN